MLCPLLAATGLILNVAPELFELHLHSSGDPNILPLAVPARLARPLGLGTAWAAWPNLDSQSARIGPEFRVPDGRIAAFAAVDLGVFWETKPEARHACPFLLPTVGLAWAVGDVELAVDAGMGWMRRNGRDDRAVRATLRLGIRFDVYPLIAPMFPHVARK